ncbi:hypothetical protein GCM10009789_57600 [Kribbella sancticallisti]|uniref:AAA domain-containing protein n=1 Tax=Kribbella sancticallisti TaxID=460087 RepID=A0ABP4Q0D8_9ACTN
MDWLREDGTIKVAGLGIAEVPDTRGDLREVCTGELRYPADSVVVLAGIPGAGKSTLLHRLFPDGGAEYGVRVLDSARLRADWMQVLGAIPYSWWRPLLHLGYYVHVLREMRRGGPLVVHDCATRPWVRRLLGWSARRSNLKVHLLLLDVPADVARAGQQTRGRVVLSRTMATHCRRWPHLIEQATEDPGRVVPGAVSALILNRRQANEITGLTFEPASADPHVPRI